MNVSIFGAFGYLRPQNFGGNFTSEMGSNINKSRKGTPLLESASFEPSRVKKSGERSDL